MFGASGSFDDDDDDSMEIPSPPRSARKVSSATTPSPAACCLFPTPTTTASSISGSRRPPLTAAARRSPPTGNERQSTPIVRKRSSDERIPNAQHHLSPSIMTMDGRILQSQNPFSSPVVLEQQQQLYVSADAHAPSLPTMYNHHGQHTKYRKMEWGDSIRSSATNGAGVTSLFPMMQHGNPDTPRLPPTPAKLKPKQRPSTRSLTPRSTTTPSSRFANDFDIIEILGSGCFGTVYTVMSRLDGCLYAVKQIAKIHTTNSEVYALAAISESSADPASRHIVRYHQSWMEEPYLYIQTELCSGTMRKEKTFRPYKVLSEMLQALEFIHRHGMCHLDIKPENIFIKNDQYKLGDFGLVVSRSAPRQMIEEGDARYMSLELLSGDTSDLTKADIFSLGITIYEGMTNRPLPSSGDEWQRLRRTGVHLFDDPNQHDANLTQIVTVMMQPGKRPSADVLLHTYSFQPMPQRQALTRANTWSGGSMWNKNNKVV